MLKYFCTISVETEDKNNGGVCNKSADGLQTDAGLVKFIRTARRRLSASTQTPKDLKAWKTEKSSFYQLFPHLGPRLNDMYSQGVQSTMNRRINGEKKTCFSLCTSRKLKIVKKKVELCRKKTQ